jgi:uncharacterized protein with HEPN domain
MALHDRLEKRRHGRHIYRHEYEVVDPAVVWHTVTVELEPLERVVRHELSRIEEGEGGARSER